MCGSGTKQLSERLWDRGRRCCVRRRVLSVGDRGRRVGRRVEREGREDCHGIVQKLKMIQEAPHLLRLKDFERGERQQT